MRKEGWERRLNEKLDEARTRPYVIGAWDCFRLSCEVVEALTGKPSKWPEWEGKYSNEGEAIVLIMERGGFMKAASDFFGIESTRVHLARRGDIVAYRDTNRMRHLGVCVGDKVAVLGPSGLLFVPLAGCICAWRID